jgi:uncharacterized repeat protein (TIGR01451 family)
VLVVSGLLIVVSPGLVSVNSTRAALMVVAGLAFIQAIRVANSRRKEQFQQTKIPTVDQIRTATPPGEELEEATRPFWKRPTEFYRLSSRDGIRAAAIAVLTRYENLSEEEARDRIDDGAWTDDTDASRFLKHPEEEQSTSRLKQTIPTDSGYPSGVRESISSIAAIAGVDSNGPTETDTATENKTDDTGQDEGSKQSWRDWSTQKSATVSLPADGETGVRARRETSYWRGISTIVLISTATGLFFEQPGILLLGVVGLGYGAYARSHAISPGELSVERSVSEIEPALGDDIEVTVSLTNDGDGTLFDVRFVDGVPEPLHVSEGSPSMATTLRPGETVEWTYSVQARRGVHTFDSALALVRNLPGTIEYEQAIGTDEPTEVTCVPEFQPLPVPVSLRTTSARYTGTQPTDASGHGTEFYATRMYQHGDTISRIDWNRRAKTGELSTILFRKEQATSVVLLVDNELGAYVAPAPHTEHAVDRAVMAAGQLFDTIADEGHFVGLSSVAETDCWLPPSRGSSHRSRARHMLARHPALQSRPTETQYNPTRVRRKIKRRLPQNAQIILISPLCRQSITRFARELNADDYPVTVVSPDPTTGETPTQQLAQVGRRVNITDIRQDGIPVLDWDWDEPLASAIARFSEREEVTV